MATNLPPHQTDSREEARVFLVLLIQRREKSDHEPGVPFCEYAAGKPVEGRMLNQALVD